MSKKSFGFKNFFFSFVIVCIVIYIFQNYNKSAKIIVAEKGNLENVVYANGVVVKDEEIFRATVDGNITYYHDDGQKINKGLLVADLYTNNDSVQIQNQIKEIELALDYKKNSKESEVPVTNLLKTQVSLNINEIQSSIFNNDLDSMYELIGQVNGSMVKDYGNDKYSDYDISKLESLKENLVKSLQTNKIPYYSKQSGIITYKIDGLENMYNFKGVLELKASNTIKLDVSEKDSNITKAVLQGEELFKIIQNYDYYIVVNINNEYAKSFEEDKYIKTRIKSGENEHEVWGIIKKINYGSESSVLIIYFDDYFYKIYDKRYVDIELITDTYEGLKIDPKALIEKNNIKGVYVKDVSNIIKFFPVEIVGKDDEIAIISQGNYVSETDRRVIYIFDNKYETIKIFDKVVTEPEKVIEGQIVE